MIISIKRILMTSILILLLASPADQTKSASEAGNGSRCLRPVAFAEKTKYVAVGILVVFDYNDLLKDYQAKWLGRVEEVEGGVGKQAEEMLTERRAEYDNTVRRAGKIKQFMGEDKSARAFIGALKKIEGGALSVTSAGRTEEVATALNLLNGYFGREIQFDHERILFISRDSWLPDLFGFISGQRGQYCIITDGNSQEPIFLISEYGLSHDEVAIDILHEVLHDHFIKGMNNIQNKEAGLHAILNEAVTEMTTLVIMKRYLSDQEQPPPVSTEYVGERNLVQSLHNVFGDEADQAIERFLIIGDSEGLQKLLGPAWNTLLDLININFSDYLDALRNVFLAKINQSLQEATTVAQGGAIDLNQLDASLKTILAYFQHIKDEARAMTFSTEYLEIDWQPLSSI